MKNSKHDTRPITGDTYGGEGSSLPIILNRGVSSSESNLRKLILQIKMQKWVTMTYKKLFVQTHHAPSYLWQHFFLSNNSEMKCRDITNTNKRKRGFRDDEPQINLFVARLCVYM